jgi:hypothetical protein
MNTRTSSAGRGNKMHATLGQNVFSGGLTIKQVAGLVQLSELTIRRRIAQQVHPSREVPREPSAKFIADVDGRVGKSAKLCGGCDQIPAAGPIRIRQSAASGGPYTTAPHSRRHLR